MSKSLNHMQLVEAVAAETGLPRDTVSAVLRGTFDVIGQVVTDGGKVTVTNFGSWFSRAVAARQARNPQTGGRVTVPAGRRAAFRWSPKMKGAVASGTVLDTLKKLPSH